MIKENELRAYVNSLIRGTGINVQWVEPGRFGSTMGAADCILKLGVMSISLELKIWEVTRNGIRCEMRPVQRQWHHNTMKNGGRCAVLFNLKGTTEMGLVRGDHVPLRPYASDKMSGCHDGKLRHMRFFGDFRWLMDDDFWTRDFL